MKATWGILNSVIKKHKVMSTLPNHFIKDNNDIHDVKKIVNEFNAFFVNIGPSLAMNIPHLTDNNTDGYITDNINSIFLGKIEKDEILNIVKDCESKKSTDCDDIDMSTLKYIIESVIEPFTYICNLSFSTGVFPENMKTAKVIPLYKNGDKHVFSNYRPVSLLPQFSKILEKLFVNRLDRFLNRYNILSSSQSLSFKSLDTVYPKYLTSFFIGMPSIDVRGWS